MWLLAYGGTTRKVPWRFICRVTIVFWLRLRGDRGRGRHRPRPRGPPGAGRRPGGRRRPRLATRRITSHGQPSARVRDELAAARATAAHRGRGEGGRSAAAPGEARAPAGRRSPPEPRGRTRPDVDRRPEADGGRGVADEERPETSVTRRRRDPVRPKWNPWPVARVLLLGLMGSGKTTVGQRPRQQAGVVLHRQRRPVEQSAGVTKASLRGKGAAGLRAAEAQALRLAIRRPGPLVAGRAAGVVLDPDDAAPLEDPPRRCGAGGSGPASTPWRNAFAVNLLTDRG